MGGKSHEFVVELLGVVAGHQGVADDRVAVHADQAAGLADADPLGDVAQDGHDLVLRQLGAEQRCPFALREAGFTRPAAEQTPASGAIAHGDRQIALAALAVVGTLGILTAEGTQVVRFLPSLAHSTSLLEIPGCWKAA